MRRAPVFRKMARKCGAKFCVRFCGLASMMFLLFILNIWLIHRFVNVQTKPRPSYRQLSLPGPQPSSEAADIYERDLATEIGFNVNFESGRLDRSRTFKLFDFVKVGSNYPKLSSRFSVCLATQSSVEKLRSLVEVAENWDGPISVALFVAGDDEYYLLQRYLSLLAACFGAVRGKVAFHLVVSTFRVPTGTVPEKLQWLSKRKFYCYEHEAVLKQITGFVNFETKRWRWRSRYPKNVLRNLARKNCKSENVFVTDIDIVPSRGLAKHVDKFLKSPNRRCPGKCAYVIPTYELDYRTDFPSDKKELLKLIKSRQARPYNVKLSVGNQQATNFTRWETFSDASKEVVVSHNVTNFEFLYEPFYVAPYTAPAYDERFVGYGYTRHSQVYEMRVQGYQFQVLSPVFTIKRGFKERKVMTIPWEQQNKVNRDRFEEFKKELSVKYGKDSPKSINN